MYNIALNIKGTNMPQWFVVENKKRREYIIKKGLNHLDLKKWVEKWHILKCHAVQHSKMCSLSFYDYIDLAVDAGLVSPDEIGRKNEQYNLSRIMDQGSYEIGNCRFLTKKENLLERIPSGAMKRAFAKRKSFDEGRRKNVKIELEEGSVIVSGLKTAYLLTGVQEPNISRAVGSGKGACSEIFSYTDTPAEFTKEDVELLIFWLAVMFYLSNS